MVWLLDIPKQLWTWHMMPHRKDPNKTSLMPISFVSDRLAFFGKFKKWASITYGFAIHNRLWHAICWNCEIVQISPCNCSKSCNWHKRFIEKQFLQRKILLKLSQISNKATSYLFSDFQWGKSPQILKMTALFILVSEEKNICSHALYAVSAKSHYRCLFKTFAKCCLEYNAPDTASAFRMKQRHILVDRCNLKLFFSAYNLSNLISMLIIRTREPAIARIGLLYMSRSSINPHQSWNFSQLTVAVFPLRNLMTAHLCEGADLLFWDSQTLKASR